MGGFGLTQLLLLSGIAGLANGGVPRAAQGPRLARYPRVLQTRDTTYSTSLRDPTTNAQFGTVGQLTTVNAGVTRWLSGLGTHNFYGNLNNYGQIIVSQTDWLKSHTAGGQTSDFVGHDANNGNLYIGVGASISLNDFGSASAPTYDWYLRTFTNYGSLQYCGRGDTGGSTYQLYCDIDCYNYGLIDYGQYYGNLGAAYVWRNANLYAQGATNIVNTYNYGAFRITNLVYHNVQNVLGTGCYIIGSNATLYLEDGTGVFQNPGYGQSFAGQSITFSDGTGDLHMDTAVYSHNTDFGAPVYGYGAGNAIEFYQVFPTTNIFSYDGTNGVLTVNFIGGNSVNIKIGTGYDASLFYTARNPTFYNTAGYNAVFYRGAAPSQATPTVCAAPAVATCQDPENTAGPFASSTSATGYVTTTVPYSGAGTITGPITSTISPSGTALGTVEIFTPAAYATATSASNGLAAPFTTTIPQVGTTPGTIVVVTPAAYVTATTTSPVSAAFTTTVAPSGTAPGTVLIVDPAAYITETTTSNVAAPVTATIPADGTNPGTIIVINPGGTTSAPTTSPTATRPAVISTTVGPNQCVCRPVT